jgi:hypothetical protein
MGRSYLARLGSAVLCGLVSPVQADDCRLALALALDVSGSVDAAEYRLMHEGLARALRAPDVVEAFLAGDPVALYVFEWAGQRSHRSLLPGWQMVERAEDLNRIAGAVARFSDSPPRLSPSTPTALGAALAHAGHALSKAPDCRAATVDISGDGWNNDGIGPGTAYSMPELQRVTVNALVIDAGPEDVDRLLEWFRSEVLHGPGAFHILTDGYEDFERAMETKLQRELELPLLGEGPADRPHAG